MVPTRRTMATTNRQRGRVDMPPMPRTNPATRPQRMAARPPKRHHPRRRPRHTRRTRTRTRAPMQRLRRRSPGQPRPHTTTRTEPNMALTRNHDHETPDPPRRAPRRAPRDPRAGRVVMPPAAGFSWSAGPGGDPGRAVSLSLAARSSVGRRGEALDSVASRAGSGEASLRRVGGRSVLPIPRRPLGRSDDDAASEARRGREPVRHERDDRPGRADGPRRRRPGRRRPRCPGGARSSDCGRGGHGGEFGGRSGVRDGGEAPRGGSRQDRGRR